MTVSPEAQRHTSKELYQVVYRELRSSALPGRPAKQAPRLLVMLLEAQERLVTSPEAATDLRIFAWFRTGQRCGSRTIAVSTHQTSQSLGGGVQWQANTLEDHWCRQEHPEQTGGCVVLLLREGTSVRWMQTGWRLRLADYPRDYLLLTPATCLGVVRAELRYDTGFAILNRTLSAARLQEVPPALAVFRSASLREGFNAQRQHGTELRERRTELPGRLVRQSRARIQNIQKAVVRTFHDSVQGGPLWESETFTHMEEFLVTKGCSEDLRTKLIQALHKWNVAVDARKRENLKAEVVGSEVSKIRAVPEEAIPDKGAEPESTAALRLRRGVEDTLWSKRTLWAKIFERGGRRSERRSDKGTSCVCVASGAFGLVTVWVPATRFQISATCTTSTSARTFQRARSTTLSASFARGPRPIRTPTQMLLPRRPPQPSRVWSDGQSRTMCFT